MAIPIFNPEDYPSRVNFNQRIMTANADIAAKQNRLTGTKGQVVGFDASGKAVAQAAPVVDVDSIATGEIDRIMGEPPEFSCTMEVSGSGRNGQSWSVSCTLDFWSNGESYSGNGAIGVDAQGGIINKCTVSGVPADKVTQNSLRLSDSLFLDRNAAGEYESLDTAGLTSFFGTSGTVMAFTAEFVNRDGPSPSAEQGVEA